MRLREEENRRRRSKRRQAKGEKGKENEMQKEEH